MTHSWGGQMTFKWPEIFFLNFLLHFCTEKKEQHNSQVYPSTQYNQLFLWHTLGTVTKYALAL